MQIPFIKYIEALVACKYPVDIIYNKILQLGIPLSAEFTIEAVAEVYSKVASFAPEYFANVGGIPEPEWLRELGIIKFVANELKLQIPENTLGIEGSKEILKDKSMYEIMTSLALAKVTDEDIELFVNGKYNIHYSIEDIKEFLHYYFNVEGWTLSHKKDYVSIINDVRLKKFYNYALDGDKDYLVWKLGIAPEKSFDAILRDMGTDSFYNFKEKMKASPDEAIKWGQLFIRLADRLDRIEKDTEDKKDLFTQVTFVLSGKKEEDLYENVIDGTGTVVKVKSQKRKNISDLNEED